jgi:hypothetical protein
MTGDTISKHINNEIRIWSARLTETYSIDHYVVFNGEVWAVTRMNHLAHVLPPNWELLCNPNQESTLEDTRSSHAG